jgi:hypothetical protein
LADFENSPAFTDMEKLAWIPTSQLGPKSFAAGRPIFSRFVPD